MSINLQKITGRNVFIYSYVMIMIADTLAATRLFSGMSLVTAVGYILKFTAIALSLLYLSAFFLHKRPVRELCIVTLGVLLLLYTSICISDMSFLTMAILIFDSYCVSDEDFLNLYIDTHVCQVIFWIITWGIGIALGKEGIYYGVYSYQLQEQRMTFGCSSPNQFAIRLGWLLIAIIIYKKYSINSLKFYLIILVGTFFFLTTKVDSFYGFYTFVILYILINKFKTLRIVVKNISTHIYLVLSLASYMIFQAYNGYGPTYLQNISENINKFFTQRIAMSAVAIKRSGLTFLGHKLVDMNVPLLSKGLVYMSGYTIDMLYAAFFAKIGIFYLIVFIVCFYMLSKRYNTLFSICIITFAIYSLIEATTISITTSFVVFYFRNLIFRDKLENSKLWSNSYM